MRSEKYHERGKGKSKNILPFFFFLLLKELKKASKALQKITVEFCYTHCIQSLTINVAEFMHSNKEEITLYFSTVFAEFLLMFTISG